MADVLTTGVWNRIMISDLGLRATPISLLVSLRYFLAPLGVWAGRMSDQHRVLGFKRLFWIWLGRGLMVLSTFGLGYATAQLVQDPLSSGLLIWLMIIASMLAFSFGNALSGTTFLSLIYDRATDDQRGRAVGIVWTFLLLGFTVGGILFSLLLPDRESATGIAFSGRDVLMLFVTAGSIFLSLWFFSVLGEESRRPADTSTALDTDEIPTTIKEDLAQVWQTPAMRFFLFYLTLSMFFAFAQDPILEPFAGDVFDMSASTTNRFAAYWGSTSILGTIFFLWLSRKLPRFTNTVMAQLGVSVLFLTFLLFASSSIMTIEGLVTPGLLALGIGLGMWNVGTLGLMMDMSPAGRAGTFLGFWSMSVTLSRGGGITFGGIARDVGVWLSGGNMAIAYGIVFGCAAIGLAVALYSLSQVNVDQYKDQHDDALNDVETVLAGSLD